jgi:hypothetical protein
VNETGRENDTRTEELRKLENGAGYPLLDGRDTLGENGEHSADDGSDEDDLMEGSERGQLRLVERTGGGGKVDGPNMAATRNRTFPTLVGPHSSSFSAVASAVPSAPAASSSARRRR